MKTLNFGNAGGGRLLRALAQPVSYLGLAMIAVIDCAAVYLLIADRNAAEHNAQRRVENIVRIFDQSFTHIFHSVDASLRFLRKSYGPNAATFDLSAWVHDPSVNNGLTIEFAILDRDGRIIDSSYSKAVVGGDRSHREDFRFHRDSDNDVLFVSQPFRPSAGGNWAITISRRVAAEDGTFAGVVAGSLDPSQLGREISAVDLGRDGSVVLLGLDGVMRVRASNGEIDWQSVGRQLPAGEGVLGHAQLERSGTYWNSSSVVDDVRRLVAYRVLDSVPLIAIVGISEAEVFQHANENARIYWGVALLLTAVILIAMIWGAKRELTLTDTTQVMKEVQEALTCSQERYRLVEAAVNEGIWDWDIATGKQYLSPRWKALLGYSDEEVLNSRSSFFDLVCPEDRAALREALRAHLDEDKPYAMDLRLRRKDGEYLWVHSRGTALRDAANRPVRMLGVTSDISERKLADAMMAESRSNLARAEAMAKMGHYKVDLPTETYTWSDGIYRMMGLSPGCFAPTLNAVMELTHPEDRPALEQYRRETANGRDCVSLTVRVLKGDGQMAHVEMWSTPLKASDGAVTGWFGTVQDVTARKHAEEALAQVNHDLEQRVAERTAELSDEMRRREQAQMRLAQMQKLEAVGQLTAGIAHDFNNLLAVIRGGLEFVERAAARGLTAEPELVEAALRATRRGSELVQRLLTFARQSPLKSEPTAIDQLVLDTLRLLQRTLGPGVDIVTKLDAVTAMVCVDRSQFANALVNLALNARDAMPEGGELCIATTCGAIQCDKERTRSPTGEEVCITVSDSGTGMSEEARQRVFEPFYTTKRDRGGSGLGLSMVHGFVQQSGGRIEIESTPGRGTAVTIRLPRIDPAETTVDAGSDDAALPSERDTTVLLVEDDPDVRTVTAAQLKHLGYRVHAVANGMEAIDLIESPACIDVTLTDIVLPGGIDGVSLVKEAMHTRPKMAVLCMSGYAPTTKDRKWLAVQNIALLEKPFSSTELARAIDGALAR